MRYVCPACHGRAVGRVGTGLFYCWDCCVEFSETRNGWQVYELGDDGTPVPVSLVPIAPATARP